MGPQPDARCQQRLATLDQLALRLAESAPGKDHRRPALRAGVGRRDIIRRQRRTNPRATFTLAYAP
ncbi:MAG: hypothetical protein ACYCZF_17945 [Anaerolineae bacterium]